ncbi:hypothetical protein BDV33DRAFT_196904 [Aspergillus novoparasiticus]|uniref:Uncharacterized protein n=1 Tax=Aspergillus novoparasiticus TaxID=986946 RepID=A0A5N6E7D5_9EURO|nr:hypothetical protein BDV33DRAFT_196904 [Aspergillus novoparasiticus]
MPRHKSYTAEDIISDVRKGLPTTSRFLDRDRSMLVVQVAQEAKQNPRVGLGFRKKGRHPTLEDLFIRLLVYRYWNLRQEQLNKECFVSSTAPSSHGLAGYLSRCYGLDHNHETASAFRCGRRLREIERGVGLEGCTIVLLSSLTKFQQLSDNEIPRITNMLLASCLPDLIENGQIMQKLLQYQKLYSTTISASTSDKTKLGKDVTPVQIQ